MAPRGRHSLLYSSRSLSFSFVVLSFRSRIRASYLFIIRGSSRIFTVSNKRCFGTQKKVALISTVFFSSSSFSSSLFFRPSNPSSSTRERERHGSSGGDAKKVNDGDKAPEKPQKPLSRRRRSETRSKTSRRPFSSGRKRRTDSSSVRVRRIGFIRSHHR